MYSIKQSQMLETKAILSALFYIVGIPITLIGIIDNYGTWKADILFILSGVLIFVKIVYFVSDKNQQRRKKEMDLERQRYELDKLKKD